MAEKSRSDFSTDSDWYTYMVTHPEEFEESEEDVEEKKEYQKSIFYCEKCGYIIDETDKNFEKEESKKIKRDLNGNILECPKCKASSKYLKKIDKDKKAEILKKRKNKEERDKEKREEIERANIKDDLMDLLEDLSERLLNDEISSKRFVAIFMYLSKRIIDRNAKEIDIDWIHYRKVLLSMCDNVLSQYKVNQSAEEILQYLDEDIEQDKLYLAELRYYIEDEKFSIADYEMQERVKEYEMQENNIFKKERERELEEQYQKRRVELEEKANIRYQRRLERSIN